jgi:hypothetical protein
MHEFNWDDQQIKYTPEFVQAIVEERGISEATLQGLLKRRFIGGIYVQKWNESCVAFPICDENRNVYRAHCRRLKEKEWVYEPFTDPHGRWVPALVYGNFETATKIYVFESQWDAITLIDILNLFDEIDAGEVCLVITRGASHHGKLTHFVWPQNSGGGSNKSTAVYTFGQNDDAGGRWLERVIEITGGAYVVQTPVPHNDLGDWVKDGHATAYDIEGAIDHAEFRRAAGRDPFGPNGATADEDTEAAAPRVMIEFLKPSEVLAYEPPPGIVLVGDNHVVRDAVFVLAGPPGVGKSRVIVLMARCGALKEPWMGHDAHVCFKTLIIQNENGRYRLKLEFTDINCAELEDSLLITPPPPFGLCFDRREFREQLKACADVFQPHLVIIDPWNAAARDDRQKDYIETFNDIRTVFPPGLDGPALGIVAHTRKPYPNERASGRALLNLLAGSYVLGSIPRCVFVLQAASDDVSDERVVLTCCKNNDGAPGPRSAWSRQNGVFVPSENFDWEAFDEPDGGPKYNGTIDDLYEMIPVVDPIMRRDLIAKASGKISREKVLTFAAELLRQQRIFLHKIENEGSKKLHGYAKTPPTDTDAGDDIDLEDHPR